MEVRLHVFLFSAMDRSVWSASRHTHFSLWGKTPLYPLNKGLGGPEHRIRHCEREKSLAPAQNRNPIYRPFSLQIVAIPTKLTSLVRL
jgi:hypothetical protein